MTDRATSRRPQEHPSYQELLNQVDAWLDSAQDPLDEEGLVELVQKFAGFLPVISGLDVPEEVRDAVAAEMLTRVQTKAEMGVAVKVEREPWLKDLRDDGESAWPYWDAYRNHLRKSGRGHEPLRALTRDVEEILDLAGDPRMLGAWQRRGLVVGDVQSGKTSNFIGLMNMAADAGYKLFIVVGGHTDDLRKQTQKRVDEGFIGRRSLGVGRDGQHHEPSCGVGKESIRELHTVISLTTEESDFGAVSKNALRLGDMGKSTKAPAVLVVKKNSRILQNLAEWLRRDAPAEGLSVPMMLIDDEADYASVNTNKKEKVEATAVNAAIREILACAPRATYVGFTATPFANVLIDSDEEDDLFPRDYIYSLVPPGDYMGALTYFGEEVRDRYSRTEVGDAEDFFPFGHKKDHHVPGLPETLKRAIETFVIACVITDLREGRGEARSMLINVSRYNDVQGQVHRLVAEYLEGLSGVVQYADAECLLAGTGAEPIQRLRKAWESEYPDCGCSWREVASRLPKSVQTIETELVNRTTDKERRKRGESRGRNRSADGRRVISVGGMILSRGLTLEGLTTSYFYQRTQLSDTLLQMGRWFGYRKGYEDLVRIWIDPEVRGWFHFAATTLEEIRDDIRLMRNVEATPAEFGLKIRQHPETLKITAANKMRHAENEILSTSFAQQSVETKTAAVAEGELGENRKAFAALMESCESQAADPSLPAEGREVGSHRGYSEVQRSAVEDFLDGFVPGPKDSNFSRVRGQRSLISAYIRAEAERHGPLWDVAVIAGKGPKTPIPGLHLELPSNRRDTADIRTDRRTHLAFSSRRVASEKNLLHIAQGLGNGRELRWEEASRGGEVKEHAVPAVIDRPILMIYPISWHPESRDGRKAPINAEEGLLGLKVTFPAVRDGKGRIIQARARVRYAVNKVWLAEVGLDEETRALEENDDE